MAMKSKHLVLFVLSIVFCLFALGCSKEQPESAGKGEENASTQNTDRLVVISPHSNSIKREFEHHFAEYYLEKYGRNVEIEWRDVGGGSSLILRYLQNIYSRSDTAEIDVLFGGGEYPVQVLAKEGLLEKLYLSDDVLEQIPAKLSGMPLYDSDHYWCGYVVSGFGFIYNVQILERLKLHHPLRWEDLGGSEFYPQLILADPTQSGSVAAAYEMIVQSAGDWQKGWERLHAIISNCKMFKNSAGSAADSPMLGESVAAICIDFYGFLRVVSAPDIVNYISPEGQTGFTPDPVAILKNPAHPETAARFVDFLLSLKGQALWALPAGHKEGPVDKAMNRQPIRKDFYEVYRDDMPNWMQNPHTLGAELEVDGELRAKRYGTLARIVNAAAIENHALMLKAKKKLIDNNYPSALTEIFNRLPENIRTSENLLETCTKMEDTAAAAIIVDGWIEFFRKNYQKVIEG